MITAESMKVPAHPCAEEYFKEVGGVTMSVRREWDGSTLYIMSQTVALVLDSGMGSPTPLWRHQSIMPFVDGLLHGSARRLTYHFGKLYETTTAEYSRGVQHGLARRVTECDSLTQRYRWTFTEENTFDNGVAKTTTVSFTSSA